MSATMASDAEELADPPRILVVEDEGFIRDLIVTVLRELGSIVAEAANADEAWSYLTSGFSADLVFTDNKMPGSMTGTKLAARIKAEYPESTLSSHPAMVMTLSGQSRSCRNLIRSHGPQLSFPLALRRRGARNKGRISISSRPAFRTSAVIPAQSEMAGLKTTSRQIDKYLYKP